MTTETRYTLRDAVSGTFLRYSSDGRMLRGASMEDALLFEDTHELLLEVSAARFFPMFHWNLVVVTVMVEETITYDWKTLV